VENTIEVKFGEVGNLSELIKSEAFIYVLVDVIDNTIDSGLVFS